MKNINIVNGPQNVSAIVQGCMRMPALTKEEAAKVIRTAYDCGVNFFDHATCYGNGEAETRFAEAFPIIIYEEANERFCIPSAAALVRFASSASLTISKPVISQFG